MRNKKSAISYTIIIIMLATQLIGSLGAIAAELDTIAPVITISKPTDGTSLTKGDSFIVSAEATDTSGIAEMAIYLDADNSATSQLKKVQNTNSIIGVFTSSGFSIGTHTLYISAVDGSSASNRSVKTVQITVVGPASDTTAPDITISSPSNNSTYTQGQVIPVSAKATDESGIYAIALCLDSPSYSYQKTITYTSSLSYNLNTSSLSTGTHVLYIKAYDGSTTRNIATKSVQITINPKQQIGLTNEDFDKVVTVTGIKDGSAYTLGQSIPISINVAMSGFSGSISLYLDSGSDNSSSKLTETSSSSLSYNLDTNNITAAEHELYVYVNPGIGNGNGIGKTYKITVNSPSISFPKGTSTSPVVIVDGQLINFDVPPIIINSRTLAPLRMIFEALGATISWNDVTKTVTAVKGNTNISIQIGSVVAYRNGKQINLDVPARLTRGRTLVPLRFVSEALGSDVGWDQSSYTVTIKSSNDATNSQNSDNQFNNTPVNLVKPKKAKVGVVFSRQTETSGMQSSHPGSNMGQVEILKREQLVYDMLVEKGYAVEKITDDDLKSVKTLKGFRTIVLPYTFMMSEEQDIAVREYVKGGGGLVALFAPSRVYPPFNLWIKKFKHLAWEWGPLSEVFQIQFINDPFGIKFEVTDKDSKHPIITRSKEVLGTKTILLYEYVASAIEEAEALPGGVNKNVAPFLWYSNGDAAAWQGRYGYGRFAYFSFRVMDFWWHDRLSSQAETAKTLVDKAVEWTSENDGILGKVDYSAKTIGKITFSSSGLLVRHYLRGTGNVQAIGNVTTSIYDAKNNLINQEIREDAGAYPGTDLYWSSNFKVIGKSGAKYKVVIEYQDRYKRYTHKEAATVSYGQSYVPTKAVK